MTPMPDDGTRLAAMAALAEAHLAREAVTAWPEMTPRQRRDGCAALTRLIVDAVILHSAMAERGDATSAALLAELSVALLEAAGGITGPRSPQRPRR